MVPLMWCQPFQQPNRECLPFVLSSVATPGIETSVWPELASFHLACASSFEHATSRGSQCKLLQQVVFIGASTSPAPSLPDQLSASLCLGFCDYGPWFNWAICSCVCHTHKFPGRVSLSYSAQHVPWRMTSINAVISASSEPWALPNPSLRERGFFPFKMRGQLPPAYVP